MKGSDNIHKSRYHAAYAAIHEACDKPNDAKLAQKAISEAIRIIMDDPNSTVRVVCCTLQLHSFDYDCVAANGHADETYISIGRNPNPYDGMFRLGDRYVDLAAYAGGRYTRMRMTMRRFLSNLKAIGLFSTISAYCALRGVDLNYDPGHRKDYLKYEKK